MNKCLDLSKFPKPTGLRSVNRRHVTPGSPIPLLFPGAGPYDPTRAVDPTHPATRWKAHSFPRFSCLAFMLRAVPKGALLRPPFERRENVTQHLPVMPLENVAEGPKRLNMSIMFMISKKKTNKRAVVRNRIATRIRAAVELIVVRGIDAEPRENVEGIGIGGRKKRASENSSNLELVSNSAPTRHLILQDWTYVMSPSLQCYRMPLPELIQHLRVGLKSIQMQAVKLDALWALKKQKLAEPAANDKT